MTEKKVVKGILFVAMLVSICGVIYIILAYSKYYFHSDCAGYLFLAKEQLAQKKMFPDRFHYSTDIFFLTPSVTIIPFLTVLNNELFAHELGVLLYIGIICALVFKLFWHDKKAAVITVALFYALYHGLSLICFFPREHILQCAFLRCYCLLPYNFYS